MAKVRLAGLTYVPAGWSGKSFHPVPWNSAGQFTAEEALRISADLRSRGFQATAIADGGGHSLERELSIKAPVDETIAWPAEWRLSPIEKISSGYVYRFFDYVTSTDQTISGRSPQAVVDKLHTINHPIYSRLIETLPIVEPPPAELPPAIEQAVQRRLRDADLRAIPVAMPERPPDTHAEGRRSIEFEAYVDSLSAAELKEKMKDKTFVARMDALPRR